MESVVFDFSDSTGGLSIEGILHGAVTFPSKSLSLASILELTVVFACLGLPTRYEFFPVHFVSEKTVLELQFKAVLTVQREDCLMNSISEAEMSLSFFSRSLLKLINLVGAR